MGSLEVLTGVLAGTGAAAGGWMMGAGGAGVFAEAYAGAGTVAGAAATIDGVQRIAAGLAELWNNTFMSQGDRNSGIYINGKPAPSDYHRNIKEKILKQVREVDPKFMKEVGSNPNVDIRDGKMILVGQGPFKGKTYPLPNDFTIESFF